jgi:hypothetical protein
LFVEVGDAGRDAAVPDVTNPGRVAPTMPSPAFPTGDHPVETLEVEFVDWPEQRLGADEADGGRDPA